MGVPDLGDYVRACVEHLISLGFSLPEIKYFVSNLIRFFFSIKTFVNYAFAAITQRCHFLLSVVFVRFVEHPNRFSTPIQSVKARKGDLVSRLERGTILKEPQKYKSYMRNEKIVKAS